VKNGVAKEKVRHADCEPDPTGDLSSCRGRGLSPWPNRPIMPLEKGRHPSKNTCSDLPRREGSINAPTVRERNSPQREATVLYPEYVREGELVTCPS